MTTEEFIDELCPYLAADVTNQDLEEIVDLLERYKGAICFEV